MIYRMRIAERNMLILLSHRETAKVFEPFIEEPLICDIFSEEDNRSNIIIDNFLKASEEIINEYIRDYHTSPYRAEADALIPVMSDWLLPKGCVFHSAAFWWKGKAYLLTGPSGIGKTTQLRNWMDFYPEETELINGDKPIVCFEDNTDKLIVYPSPWNGKENMKGNKTGELGGIICLQQSNKNEICVGEKKDIIPFLFREIFTQSDGPSNVAYIAAFLERVLQRTRVWTYKNVGDQMSTRFLHDYFLKFGERFDENDI